ncbi:phosphate ABC transporter permease PstA [candidate division WOR-3 bacterium]|nr:phosphate ABC transporter permease PstA [candidate division WOR-3 bacterium]
MNWRKIKAFLGVNALRFSILISVLFLFFFIVLMVSKGGRMISWSFLTDIPRAGMTKGGIFPAIVGTFCLTIGAIVIAFPLGLLAAIYLVEYAKEGYLMSMIRIAISTLAGIPSIIFGLFGLAIFVIKFRFGVSILSGSLTLSIMILPIIIKASEEAIKAVPDDFREASYALGATKRETIIRVVIPTALPNILTGAIMSVGRAAGETAPILFTAATFYTRKLPKSIFDEVMALPYHIYALMTEGTSPEYQVPIAYGTAVVLLGLVLAISAIAIIIRYRMRRMKKW